MNIPPTPSPVSRRSPECEDSQFFPTVYTTILLSPTMLEDPGQGRPSSQPLMKRSISAVEVSHTKTNKLLS